MGNCEKLSVELGKRIVNYARRKGALLPARRHGEIGHSRILAMEADEVHSTPGALQSIRRPGRAIAKILEPDKAGGLFLGLARNPRGAVTDETVVRWRQEAALRVFVESGIIADFFMGAYPRSSTVDMLMLLGRCREFQLWMGASQLSALCSRLVECGLSQRSIAAVLRRMRGFVRISLVGEAEVDAACLSETPCLDAALVAHAARRLNASAVISANPSAYGETPVAAFTAEGFFAHLACERGTDYAFVSLPQ